MTEINQEKISKYLGNIKKKYNILEAEYNILVENYMFIFSFTKKTSSISFIKIENGVGSNKKYLTNDISAYEFFNKNIGLINDKLGKVVK